MSKTIASVSELLSVLEEYNFQFSQTHRKDGFIFRGVSNCEWKLIPGVFREFEKEQQSRVVVGGAISGNVYGSPEYEILAHFK